ncbi:hypothetical protein LSPH24S_04428 [Lysinibacillus sphaericus]
MDLHALNIFKSVAEKGSISQAARDLQLRTIQYHY